FSSRRRHTRFSRDWSSDVCSSDLNVNRNENSLNEEQGVRQQNLILSDEEQMIYTFITEQPRSINEIHEHTLIPFGHLNVLLLNRSEERRVGKECRYWWSS